MSTNPRTVDEVFKDFKGRRLGMLKALTAGRSTGMLRFFSFCSCSVRGAVIDRVQGVGSHIARVSAPLFWLCQSIDAIVHRRIPSA